jgi:hypothetical protein
MSLWKLANASGLRSASYVFHIENGHKAPSEEVASRLAMALGDDPALYRAWARARSRTDLSTAMESAETLRRLLGAPPGEALSEPAFPAVGNETGRVPLVRVPLLEEGADPDHRDLAVLDWMDLDPKIFPPGLTPILPFAYRLTAHGVRRLPDLLHPGDCVVVSRADEPPMDDTAYAVRIGPRVELSRVQRQGDDLVLPAGTREREPERLAAPAGGAASERIVGRVVVALRRWL